MNYEFPQLFGSDNMRNIFTLNKSQLHRKNSNNKGFTLVELIVVIVVLAVMAALLVPALLGYMENAQKHDMETKAESVKTVAQGVFNDMYNISNNSDPISTAIVKDTGNGAYIRQTSGMESTDVCFVGVVGPKASDSKKSHYAIKSIYYTDGKTAVYFDGTEWKNVSTILSTGNTDGYKDCQIEIVAGKYKADTDTPDTKDSIEKDPDVPTTPVTTKTIKDDNVTLTGSFVYDGEEKEPTVSVVVDGKTLVKGTDYTVKFTNNIDAGNASTSKKPTVTITGYGDYSGKVDKYFTIAPKNIADASITTKQIENFEYTGSAITPDLEIKDTAVAGATVTLAKVTDYTLAGAAGDNMTKEGTHTLVVTGTGNYTGTREATFYICTWVKVELFALRPGNDKDTPTTGNKYDVVTLEKGGDASKALTSRSAAEYIKIGEAELSSELHTKYIQYAGDDIERYMRNIDYGKGMNSNTSIQNGQIIYNKDNITYTTPLADVHYYVAKNIEMGAANGSWHADAEGVWEIVKPEVRLYVRAPGYAALSHSNAGFNGQPNTYTDNFVEVGVASWNASSTLTTNYREYVGSDSAIRAELGSLVFNSNVIYDQNTLKTARRTFPNREDVSKETSINAPAIKSGHMYEFRSAMSDVHFYEIRYVNGEWRADGVANWRSPLLMFIRMVNDAGQENGDWRHLTDNQHGMKNMVTGYVSNDYFYDHKLKDQYNGSFEEGRDKSKNPVYNYLEDLTFTPNTTDGSGNGTFVYKNNTYTFNMDNIVWDVINTNDDNFIHMDGVCMANITFDANGGAIQGTNDSSTTYIVRIAKSLGKLPAAEQAGKTFDGWYTEKTGGTRLHETTLSTGNVTYYAHYN